MNKTSAAAWAGAHVPDCMRWEFGGSVGKFIVNVGAVYERCDVTQSRWRVANIAIIDGVKHVYVINVDRRKEVRLLAAELLADKETYRLLDFAKCG